MSPEWRLGWALLIISQQIKYFSFILTRFRIGLGHQYGLGCISLGHQYGKCDIMSKNIEPFHSRGQQLCKFIGVKEKFLHKKSLTPTGLVWDTNMTAVSLFWDTNMADVTSCEKKMLYRITIRANVFSLDLPLTIYYICSYTIKNSKSE